MNYSELRECYVEADRRMKETNGHQYVIILKRRCAHCGASPNRKTKCRGWFETFLQRLSEVLSEKGVIQ